MFFIVFIVCTQCIYCIHAMFLLCVRYTTWCRNNAIAIIFYNDIMLIKVINSNNGAIMPKLASVTIYIPSPVFSVLSEFSSEQGISKSRVAAQIIQERLESGPPIEVLSNRIDAMKIEHQQHSEKTNQRLENINKSLKKLYDLINSLVADEAEGS